jgi:predicted phosphodiesterase
VSKVKQILKQDDKSEVKALKGRIRELEQELVRVTESLEKTRKAKHKIPVQGKLRTGRGAYVRMFLPDTHGHSVDPPALKAFLTDLEYLNPREIIMMGDHLDCGGFLAQHHTLGFIAETENTFESDVMAANELLDAVQGLCPKADIKYLEGNHEERIEKWIVNAVLRNGKDAAYLRTLMGPETVMHLDSRGIPYIKKSECYDGCRVQGTIRAGNCFVTHGTRHGKNAAAAMLNRFNASVVFGHVHKLMAAADRNVKDGEIGAWSVGHLSRQQPLWRHGDPTDWSQGYGFQIVQTDEDFLHINVPIMEGKSYLASLGRLLT